MLSCKEREENVSRWREVSTVSKTVEMSRKMRDGNFRRAVEVNLGYSGLKSEGD